MPSFVAKAGSVGLPSHIKETGRRVDFRTDEYTLAIETKGYRLAWSRASYCPCIPINDQTEQPDPNCTICSGAGWVLFKPVGAVSNQDITGPLDDVQAAMVGDNAAVIRGIMSGITNKKEAYDQALPRLEGMLNATVRAENKLGYYDRLINLDSTVVYSQVYDYKVASPTTKLRYPVRLINLLRTVSKVYVEGTDYTLAGGDIVWVSGKEPAVGDRLAIHYLTHPTWRVIEHPHALRLTSVKSKTESKAGNPIPLPVQAMCKLEYLL